jgi:hypothetical protein
LISPLAFGGSFIDSFASAAGGCFLSFLQLHVAKNNPMYANIFECVIPLLVVAHQAGVHSDKRLTNERTLLPCALRISVAMLMSFIARALAFSGIFCYQGVASASVVLILPGYTIRTLVCLSSHTGLPLQALLTRLAPFHSLRCSRTRLQEPHRWFRPNGLRHHLRSFPSAFLLPYLLSF